MSLDDFIKKLEPHPFTGLARDTLEKILGYKDDKGEQLQKPITIDNLKALMFKDYQEPEVRDKKTAQLCEELRVMAYYGEIRCNDDDEIFITEKFFRKPLPKLNVAK